MRRVIVPTDSLGYLLLLEPEFEPEPEVFRLQPNVSFVITFERYLDFINNYLGTINYLSVSSETLKSLLRKYRQEQDIDARSLLFAAFLKDVALGMSKELYFAETFGKGASAIIHSVEGGTILSRQDIDPMFPKVWEEAELKISKRLGSKGYELPRKISAMNAHLWKYAVVCYYLSDIKMLWSYDNN